MCYYNKFKCSCIGSRTIIISIIVGGGGGGGGDVVTIKQNHGRY